MMGDDGKLNDLDDLDADTESDMTDDDFGFDDFEGDSEFEDFDTGGGSLADAWRNNPFMKIGAVVGGIILIVFVVSVMGGDSQETSSSRVGPGSDVSDIPGNEEVSPEYRQAIDEQNTRRVEIAIQEGTSALPTPINTDDGRLAIDDETEEREDPLDRWRRIQEERQKQQALEKKRQQQQAVFQQQQQAFSQQNQGENAEQSQAIDALAQAMAQQMEGILGTIVPAGTQTVQITSADYIENKREAEVEQQAAVAAAQAEVENTTKILIPAGTIEYGQLLIEANSDAGGTILAEMVSGPYAGSRLLGSFEVRNDFLVLTFNTIMIDDVGYSAEIVALDPDRASLGLVTDIDRRYFKRIILPAAARFVEGVGSAISESASSSTTINAGDNTATTTEQGLDTKEELGKGVEEAAQRVSEILDEEGDNTEPLITVAPGTAMGLMFVQPVTEF